MSWNVSRGFSSAGLCWVSKHVAACTRAPGKSGLVIIPRSVPDNHVLFPPPRILIKGFAAPLRLRLMQRLFEIQRYSATGIVLRH